MPNPGKTVYGKLVRDNIPQIIEAKGQKANCRILSDEEYIIALNRKLDEEHAEYRKDLTVEKLSDMIEVIYAIAEAKGVSPSQLNKIRNDKADRNGKFKKKIYLESVETE